VGVTEATEAGDGNEAIALFKPGEFDLVLTDWNMPGQAGIDVARAIRAQDAIIMITTEADKERVMQAIQAGVTDYLLKPFTPDSLREKLSKHGCG
jgi:two-component system chemotaxis response regulator CheY